MSRKAQESIQKKVQFKTNEISINSKAKNKNERNVEKTIDFWEEEKKEF